MERDGQSYILKGYGDIDPAWVRDCFQLFRQHGVNMRRLLLLKNGHPDCFSMLEIQFVLTSQANGFLDRLDNCLARQQWTEKSLQQAP